MKGLNLGFSCLAFSTAVISTHPIPTLPTLKGAVCLGLDFICTIQRDKCQTWCQSGAMESGTGERELQDGAFLPCLQK